MMNVVDVVVVVVVDSIPMLSTLRREVGPVEESGGEKTAQLETSHPRIVCNISFQNS